MDYTKEDTFSIDLGNISCDTSMSSTGIAWDPHYGAIPSITISPNTWPSNSAGHWTIDDSRLLAPNSAKIQLTGENADIEINGRSVMQILDGIESRLGLLHTREDLENEWSELKALGDRYREMVRNIEEKSKMWDTLKKMPPPEIK